MIRSTEDFRSLLKAARRAGTPLLAVRTADPASAMAQVSACLCAKTDVPVFAWDIMGGIVARNKAARETTAHVFGEKAAVVGPVDVLLTLHKSAAVKQFADAIVFFNNPQRIWEQVDIVQGVWNLRDAFKVGGQMLVLVTTPGSVLPVELQNDVMVIDEPLPSGDDLRQIVPGMFESAGRPATSEKKRGTQMGDRAYVEIVCREEDEPLFETIGFMEEFRHALPPNVMTMVDAEASDGATTELQALAEKGIVFRGWHDAGGAYDGACFASDGGKFYAVPRLNHSDLPCIEVHVDGTIDADQLLAAREYFRASERACEMLGLPVGSELEKETP